MIFSFQSVLVIVQSLKPLHLLFATVGINCMHYCYQNSSNSQSKLPKQKLPPHLQLSSSHLRCADRGQSSPGGMRAGETGDGRRRRDASAATERGQFAPASSSEQVVSPPSAHSHTHARTLHKTTDKNRARRDVNTTIVTGIKVSGLRKCCRLFRVLRGGSRGWGGLSRSRR